MLVLVPAARRDTPLGTLKRHRIPCLEQLWSWIMKAEELDSRAVKALGLSVADWITIFW